MMQAIVQRFDLAGQLSLTRWRSRMMSSGNHGGWMMQAIVQRFDLAGQLSTVPLKVKQWIPSMLGGSKARNRRVASAAG